MSITKNEADLLRNIAENQYTDVNGARPHSINDVGAIWSNCLNAPFAPVDIAPKSIPGIMSSLVQKGLAKSDGETVWLTAEGFAAYQQSA